MEKITDAQIERALELHSVEGKILRLLKRLDEPEKRFLVLVSASILSGISLAKLSDWVALDKKDAK